MMPLDYEGEGYDENNEDDDVKFEAELDLHNTMLGGIARIGRVVEKGGNDPNEPVDIPRVLVQIGGSSKGSYIRNWMPWITSRAGYDGEWWQPELHEQVLVLAPSGKLEQGIIVGSLYRGSLTFDKAGDNIIARDPVPSSETDKQIHQRIYQDGTSISYDRNTHNLAVELKSSPYATSSLQFIASMDPESAPMGTGKAILQIGNQSAPDIEITIDSTSGGELQVVSKLKTTLIAGSAVNPKVKVLTDASMDGEVTIEAQGNVSVTTAADVAIVADGAVSIEGSSGVTITGNVVVKGSLDVQTG